jgi:hypothetical protein
MVEQAAKAEPLSRLEEMERENANFRTWGIIEIAVRNPNVSEYMNHWEGRATKAEAEIAALQEKARRYEDLLSKAEETLGAASRILSAEHRIALKGQIWGEQTLAAIRAALSETGRTR